MSYINAPIEKVWAFFTGSRTYCELEFCTHESWHCPKAENNLEIGGEFFYTMVLKTNQQVLFFMERIRKIFTSKMNII